MESNPMNHPKAPHNQAFNINAKHTDKRGWWLAGHNNGKQKAEKQ